MPFNFTWTFSGAASAVEWGIKKSDGDAFTPGGKILSLSSGGTKTFHKSGYDGRLTGHWISGQVVFAFNAVNRNDANTYLCILRSSRPQDSDQYDHVRLVVEGNHGYFLLNILLFHKVVQAFSFLKEKIFPFLLVTIPY